VNWDREQPYVWEIRVRKEHIDGLGHVNNAVYLQWLEQCAWKHSQTLGLSLETYQALDRAMVIHRHELDYLQAAFEGDELIVATWITDMQKRTRLTRSFQLIRKQDGVTLLRAKSYFVCMAISDGRPKRMPYSFVEGYGAALVASDSK
jgi:acyl-CoA thioester hydrolase